MTNCCDTWGQCTQGRDCPARTGVVTHAQACHAARVANSHLHPDTQARRFFPVDAKGECIGGFEPITYPTVDLPVVFVGPEPIEPTRPLDDDGVPLTPRETRRLIAGTVVFCGVFIGAVFFGVGYGWTRFGLDVMTYLSGAAA